LANLDTSTVSRIETGRHPNPSAASVLRMMRVLELTVIEVIGAGVRTAPPG
jgi:transcriptional regulator with XRE-family HTH domain